MMRCYLPLLILTLHFSTSHTMDGPAFLRCAMESSTSECSLSTLSPTPTPRRSPASFKPTHLDIRSPSEQSEGTPVLLPAHYVEKELQELCQQNNRLETMVARIIALLETASENEKKTQNKVDSLVIRILFLEAEIKNLRTERMPHPGYPSDDEDNRDNAPQRVKISAMHTRQLGKLFHAPNPNEDLIQFTQVGINSPE